MKTLVTFLKPLAAAALIVAAFTGCESTDDGGSVSGGVYYGVGYYDPWYYGEHCDDPDLIVTPPDRPSDPPRPTHPIASPSPPVARPMPSIPSTPRASFRR